MAAKSEWAKANQKAYQQRRQREMYARRRAEGLCLQCGKPRTAAGASGQQCAACVQKRARQYLIDSARMRAEEGRRMLRGRSSPAPMARRVKVQLQRPLIAALDELQRQRRARSPDGERIPLSQTVREAICENFGGDPPAPVPEDDFRGVMCPGVSLNLCLDARTWAVVRYHADRSFGGCVARTIRAMLWAAARAKASAGGVANPFYRVTHGRTGRPASPSTM